MATNRRDRFIETGRAELFMDVTVHERPGEGNVELTAGTAGQVSGITLGGVEIMSGAVLFNTSLTLTARDVAENINNFISSPRYHARSVGPFIYIWQQTIVAGAVVLVSTVTGDFIKTDTNLDNGVIGDGTALGYVNDGFTLEINDEFLEEPAEDDGIRNIKAFYIGENVSIDAVFKQWDERVLELRFPGRHTTGAVNSNVNRVEVPGSLTPGADMDPLFKVFELRPDNLAYATLLIRKGLAIGTAGEPTRFRTQETKKIGVTLKCYPNNLHVATAYKTVGIDLAQNLTL